MDALVYKHYGSPDVLQLKQVEKPLPEGDEVCVKIHAATVNRTDCATVRAKPFFMRLITGLLRPKKQIPGTDFAGEIDSIGDGVLSLKVGDKVFGFDDLGTRSHAGYTTIREDNVMLMPADLSYDQAAASCEGAHYACNFINKVNPVNGHSVLVNGATGAIGSAAVQLLKYFKVNVTAVCATENVELVKSLGADAVIDYKKKDFTEDNGTYDFVFDTVGKSSFFKCRHLIKPGGAYLSSELGYLSQNLFLPVFTPLIKRFFNNKKTVFPAPLDIRGSMDLIKQLIEQGEFKAVIDRKFPLEQIVEAYRYVEKGHKIGNVVITMNHNVNI